VFAGKDFSAEEFVEAGPVVNVKSAHVKWVSVWVCECVSVWVCECVSVW
jgi:hypothetical protein